MTPAQPIGNLQLLYCLLFIVASGVISIRLSLGLQRDLLVGSLRCVVQLFLMGYALLFIFKTGSLPATLTAFVVMVAFAADIVRSRVGEKEVRFLPPTFAAMALSYAVVSWTVTAVVVQVEPWWQPQYFLPLGGMVIGNSMTALSISLGRLFGELREKRELLEMRMSLGADAREASRDIAAESVRAGMVPSINSMMGVGVVFIPGMMTGQIVAGSDPMIAVRYQIMVMLMLTASSALSSFLVVFLVRRMCFDAADRLKLGNKT